MYDTIIVGAGPAGLTSAIYTCRAKKKTLVLEALSYGGQIINTLDIENYPAAPHISGFDFATKLYNQAKELGAEIVFEKVVDIKDNTDYKEVITKNNTYKTKTIILATGAENRKLGLENESNLIGRGVSYCATCDGAFYKGKDVAIQGGGNTAIEEAIYLSDIAKTVYLIHRRDEFRAEETLINQLKEKENVKFILNSNVTKLNANEKLESIEVTNKDGQSTIINISGLFIAVGRVPENENFRKIIKLNEAGYVEAKEDCHTNVEGIFTAGDNRVKTVRQLVTATADGAVAATEAIKYINGK
ncbi:MAG: thioredoxin-disulfide reductase [Bacilli bacterium]|nr:thioredoxin-disulfide reductase [Bacilli bacterium]